MAKIENCWTKMSCRDLKWSNLPSDTYAGVFSDIPPICRSPYLKWGFAPVKIRFYVTLLQS